MKPQDGFRRRHSDARLGAGMLVRGSRSPVTARDVQLGSRPLPVLPAVDPCSHVVDQAGRRPDGRRSEWAGARRMKT
jgi:hypothetical protein